MRWEEKFYTTLAVQQTRCCLHLQATQFGKQIDQYFYNNDETDTILLIVN